MLNYVSCMQKFKALFEGPLSQVFPNFVPARNYISHGVAQAMQLPYSSKEAWLKYQGLIKLCKMDWKIEEKEHSEQYKLGVSFLELG